MRINLLPLLVAGAGLVSQVSASPLRVVVVSGHADGSQALSPAGVVSTTTEVHSAGMRLPCGRMKNALNSITALFPGWNKANGNTIPEHEDETESGMAHILPVSKPGPFPIGPLFHVGTVSFEQLDEAQKAQDTAIAKMHEEQDVRPDDSAPGPLRVIHVGHRPHHHFGMGRHRSPFMHRLHFALASLGPWEGRAVAFVLGCGIGVLMRMIWVLAVVIVRTVRPGSQNTESDAVFDADLDAEEFTVSPPQYSDAKVPVVEEKMAQAEN